MGLERTFSIIKPDATRRNLTGKINAKFEDFIDANIVMLNIAKLCFLFVFF